MCEHSTILYFTRHQNVFSSVQLLAVHMEILSVTLFPIVVCSACHGPSKNMMTRDESNIDIVLVFLPYSN